MARNEVLMLFVFSLKPNSIRGHKFKVKSDTELTFNKNAAVQIIKE